MTALFRKPEQKSEYNKVVLEYVSLGTLIVFIYDCGLQFLVSLS